MKQNQVGGETPQKTETHEEKYDRLIEKCGGLEAVSQLLPEKIDLIRRRLRLDKHLNNIPLRKWDEAAGRIGSSYQCHSGIFPRGLSLAERTCILKRAATRLAS